MTHNGISAVFVFYRTLDLGHLERAIYSLYHQTVHADELVFVDNNTDYGTDEIRAVVEPMQLQMPIVYHFCKHGDTNRRHSWSANYGIRRATHDTVFFTRADYILMEDCLERMAGAVTKEPFFVSGWCWQMAYDREARNYDGNIPYEAYAWRTDVRYLLQHPYGHNFFETDQDAGVYLTTKQAMELGGWYDEKMVSFGYQQSTLQRKMRGAGVHMKAVQDFLFCHQHHAASRDFQQAMKEYRRSSGG